MDDEQPLSGGNTTVVVRVGDTVRRPIGPWTPAVHAVLDHLESVGFTGAPRVLGIDDTDREILEYVDGEAGTLDDASPLLPWFRTPEACHAIGAWIRGFQSAQAGLVLDASLPWRRSPGARLRPGQVLVHHDAAPYNTVLRPDGSIVVIDWDFMRPGDPVEDLAWAAWRWAPLMAGTRWYTEYGVAPDEDVTARQGAHLLALLEGYRPSVSQRRSLAQAITRQMLGHAADIDDMARHDPAFARLVERGIARSARDDAAWWTTVADRLLR